MTSTAELRWLHYSEEHDISMFSITTSNEKVISDAKGKPVSAHVTFHQVVTRALKAQYGE